MKRIAFLLFLLPLFTQAQNLHILPFNSGDLWGAINYKGETVIPIQYEYIKNIENYPYIVVMEDGKMGIVDSVGNFVLPLQYDKILPIRQNYFWTHDTLYGLYHLTKGMLFPSQFARYQIVDSSLIAFHRPDSNKVLLNTKTGKNLEVLTDGFFYYNRSNDTLRYKIWNKKFEGICSNEPKIIVPLVYTHVWQMGNKYSVSAGTKKGILDTNGKVIIDTLYDRIDFYSDSYLLRKGKVSMFADKNGKIIANSEYDTLWLNSNRYIAQKGNEYFLLDLSGKRVSEGYASLRAFDSYFYAYKNSKFGLINDAGKTVIPFIYSDIDQDRSFWFCTTSTGTDVLNSNFKKLFSTSYNISAIDDTHFSFTENGKTGIMNLSGQVVLTPRYAYASKISDRFFEVGENNQYGVAVSGNKLIINPEYQSIRLYDDKMFVARRAKNYYLFNTEGKRYDVKFDSVFHIGKANFNIFQEGKCGILNQNGKIIITPTYADAYFFKEVDMFYVRSFMPIYTDSITKENSYAYGVVNKFGEILLDTLYDFGSIFADPIINQLKVELDTALIVVFYDENGRYIDKTYYKHYLKVKNRSTSYKWVQNPAARNDFWGLVDGSNRIVIGYRFDDVNRVLAPLDTSLYITSRKSKDYRWLKVTDDDYTVQPAMLNKVYGIVDKNRGKEKLRCEFAAINMLDFRFAKVARAINRNRLFYLITNEGDTLKKLYRFVEDFQTGYARVSSSGKLNCVPHNWYHLNVEDYQHITGVFGLYLTLEKGKWGLIDTAGVEIIPPQYTFLQRYFHHRLIACKNNKWGIINIKNETLVDFTFNHIEHFSNPRNTQRWLNVPYYKAMSDGKYGVIDSTGKEILPFLYQDIKCFPKGSTHYFAIRTKDGWGMIDLQSNEIIPCKFASINYLNSQCDSLFKVVNANTENLYGFINKDYEIILPAEYHRINNFVNGFATVLDKDSVLKYVNKQGRIITQQRFEEYRIFNENMAAVKLNGLWGFIDSSGVMVIPPTFSFVGYFNSDLAKAQLPQPQPKGKKKNKKPPLYGYIDKSGNWAIQPQFTGADDFGEEYARVQIKGKSFFIDKMGNKATNVKISTYKNNRKKNEITSAWSYVSTDIFDKKYFKEYMAYQPFFENVAIFRYRNLYGLYNHSGEELLPPLYNELESIGGKVILARTVHTMKYIDYSGQVIKE